MTKTCLLAISLVAYAGRASAGDEWLGETVMVKETAVPQVGAKRLKWNDAPMPSVVQQINGDWLWLGTVWVKKDEVLLLDDAPAYFTTLIDGGKDKGIGYLLRGVSWLAKHEFENAVKDLDEVIRLAPNNSSFHCLRGKAYFGKHAYDQAMADYTEAIRLNPSNLIALNDRGCTWNAKEESAKALKHFDSVLRIDTRNALAYANRSATWFYLEEYEKSLADVNRAIELDPRMASAYANRGRWYMKHGDYPKALNDYNKSAELAPREWAAYNGLARIYATAPIFEAHIRDGKQALAMAKKACELSLWDEWMPVASLAAAYAELGDFEEAVKWQTKALAMSQPAKDRDQRDNLKRLDLYKSQKPYYEEVSSLKEDSAAEATEEAGV
ncbi:MAG: tetratricopeptide repeat protein [Pirellulales bacterium]